MNAFQELVELERLEENWDDCGGRPIPQAIIKVCTELLAGLNVAIPMPNNIVPLTDGGLQLEWQLGVGGMEIEIKNVDDMIVLCDNGRKSWEFRAPIDSAFLSGLLMAQG